MKFLVGILFTLCCCVYGKWNKHGETEQIGRLAVEKLSGFLNKDLIYLETVGISGEKDLNSGTTYYLDLKVVDDNTPKLCHAVLFEDRVAKQHHLYPPFFCEDDFDIDVDEIQIEEPIIEVEGFDIDERDDVPMNDEEGEDDDDADYAPCNDDKEKADLLKDIINDLNRQVDETNEEFDMPGMMDMGDLKEGKYDDASIKACKKKTSGGATTYKAEVTAKQNGVRQKCEIQIIKSNGAIKMPKSQCQGQD